MKVFLDIGAALVVILAPLFVAGQFGFRIPQSSGWNPASLASIPVAFFCFYTLWHMLRWRHWYWFMASLLLAPFTFIAYYAMHIRPQIGAHAAQHGTQADGPASSGPAA